MESVDQILQEIQLHTEKLSPELLILIYNVFIRHFIERLIYFLVATETDEEKYE